MTRTFSHTFDPSAASPVASSTVDLDVTQIEDAGIREVLQTPGTAYGAWSILDALLAPTGPGTPFIFKEPLGQAREVKVALSGLFGRFVARAYLERYFNLAIFAHLGQHTIDLDRRRKVSIKRLSRGDLPDWIACASNLSSLTVAEAKGCHDRGGPSQALARAWSQACRIDVTAGGHKVTVKRIAIATRWGMAVAGPADARIAVKDPLDEGEPLSAAEEQGLYAGLLRRHIANLIRPLGHAELADKLRDLALQSFTPRLERDQQSARATLDATLIRDVEKVSAIDGLVGGIVTRAGPLTEADVTPLDQDALARIQLRPVFVGVERSLIRAAIDADLQAVRGRIVAVRGADDVARPDSAGGWIVPLGGERHVLDRG